MTSESEKRKLTDLRVVDLRAELEKRGLDNKGVKATLIERLQKVLCDEGHDPEEYTFEIEASKTPKRTSMKRGEHDAESETQSNADENHEVMEVEEEGKEKEEEDEEKLENGKGDKEDTEKKPTEQESTTQAEPVEDVTKNVSENAVDNDLKREDTNESTKDEVKHEEPTESDKTVPEANGVDNEDSINLTIGEDEEKLLAEEEDSSSQEKEAKDEGDRGVNPEEGTAGGDGKKQAAGQKEDKETAGEDCKQEKSQEDNRDDKGGDKGKSATPSGDQKASKDEKEKRAKPAIVAGSSRNLWVSGLSSSTRATDLKQVFSKYGKVIGAKVVTNARTPGARCYGYVTMATSDDASKCIQHLHRTELHGRMISVERAKGDAAGPPKKGVDGRVIPSAKKVEEKKKHERKLSTSSKTESEKKGEKEDKVEDGKTEGESAKDSKIKPADDEKDKEESGEAANKSKEESETEKEGGGERQHSTEKTRSREVSRDRRERHRSAGSSHYSHHSRPLSRSPRRVVRTSPARQRPGVLTFTQIREERERQRLRERERELREEDRRRREETARQREIERRQREEAIRLEREKERLRIERERIEVERAELMRLERERQRMEREKLEREREELKRQQMRFEEARRGTKRPTNDARDSYAEERKRVVTERRYESSQSSRFEEGARSNDFQGKKDYKHGGEFAGRHAGSGKFEGSNYDQESRTARGEGIVMKKDSSQELPRRDHTVQDVQGRGKDGRFERGPGFRVREERRPENDHRTKVDMRHSGRDRYPEPSKGDGRYSDRSGDSWHAGGGPPPVKAFSSMSGGVPSRDSWGPGERKSDGQSWGRPIDSGSSDRWVSGSSGPMGVVGRSGPGMGGPGSMYSSQQNVPPNPPGMNMGMSGSGPYGGERFDSYKQSMGPIRKY